MPANDNDDPLWDLDGDDPGEGLAESRQEIERPTKRPDDRPGLLPEIWHPTPIPRPHVDRDLPRMPWPERCAEALRYAMHRAEHWLSGRGTLREFVRLNLWFGVGLLAVALLFVPPVTILLEGVAEWSSLVKATAFNVASTAMGLPPVVIAAASLFIAIKLLSRSWRRRRRHRGYHDDPYN